MDCFSSSIPAASIKCCSLRFFAAFTRGVFTFFISSSLGSRKTSRFQAFAAFNSTLRRLRTLDHVASSHSHTVVTLNPFSWRLSIAAPSRATFRSNFACQNLRLRFGFVALEHLACRCQKQPLTKMANFRVRFARSGDPGKSRFLSVYLAPRDDTIERTVSSGLVPWRRIWPIRFDVSAVVETERRPASRFSTRLNGRGRFTHLRIGRRRATRFGESSDRSTRHPLEPAPAGLREW